MATAPSNPTPRRDVVEFPLNTPVTVSLKYAQGKSVSGKFGERILFTLADSRVMFVSPEVAQQIKTAGIQNLDPFTITKRSGQPWEIERIRKPVAITSSSHSQPPRHGLVDEANALVDAYVTVLDRALSLHEGKVEPKEIRSLLISAYIQRKAPAA